MTDTYRLYVDVRVDADGAPDPAALADAARQLAEGLEDSDAFPNLADTAVGTHAVHFLGHGVERAPIARSLTIPDHEWHTVDGDPNVMVGHVTLNGVGMHVTAFRVDPDAEVDELGVAGAQSCPGHDEDLGLLWHIFGMDGLAATADIHGHEWLLFAEPGSR